MHLLHQHSEDTASAAADPVSPILFAYKFQLNLICQSFGKCNKNNNNICTVWKPMEIKMYVCVCGCLCQLCVSCKIIWTFAFHSLNFSFRSHIIRFSEFLLTFGLPSPLFHFHPSLVARFGFALHSVLLASLAKSTFQHFLIFSAFIPFAAIRIVQHLFWNTTETPWIIAKFKLNANKLTLYNVIWLME